MRPSPMSARNPRDEIGNLPGEGVTISDERQSGPTVSPVESTVPFQGNVRQWGDQLVSLVREYGMNGFVYWPDADHLRQLTLFALEVVPAVRAALAG